jgi:virulence factor
MKIAIIGAGGIARKAYFRFLLGMPGIEITNIYSRTQKTIDEIHGEWGITCGTASMDTVLENKPQGAIVLTATASHYEIIKLLMENGIDVYSEKSLTTESHLSHELWDLAQKTQRVLAVGFNRRYSPLFMQAKEIFGDRRIQLALIQKHRNSSGEPSLDKLYLDDTIHQIDLARYYCGEVKPVATTYTMEGKEIAGAVSQMEIPGGGQCLVAVARTGGAWQESITLHGDELTVHVNAFDRLIIKYPDHEVTYGTDIPGSYTSDMRVRGFIGQVEHFIECVNTRQTPRTNALEAAKTQELMEKLISLARETK